MLIWSRLHDRWGDPPHFTSPIWGHPPPCKQALRKLSTCSWAKYRRTASASRNLQLRPNGENQLLNWISLSTYSNLTPLVLTNWYWSELPALNISFYIIIFVYIIFKNTHVACPSMKQNTISKLYAVKKRSRAFYMNEIIFQKYS